MRRALAALLLATPLLLPQPAFAQAESREGIYLQNQILQLRQELDQLRRGGSSLGAPPVVVAPRGGAAPQGELLGQLLDRVSGLEEEVRRLRGRLEESEFRDRQLSQTVEKLQGDVDYRLQQLEGQGGRSSHRCARPRTARRRAPSTRHRGGTATRARHCRGPGGAGPARLRRRRGRGPRGAGGAEQPARHGCAVAAG
ncbi:hypothetical protein [Siccirubricoccus sp. G192]|uniref:hypothetical protein n=1 Tax=Siccirubricoccus sp. G192 TaxID=2849651 RepID=UPI0020C29D46|nr:hypothetical protein [Siccirubricoccus sp. G192]